MANPMQGWPLCDPHKTRGNRHSCLLLIFYQYRCEAAHKPSSVPPYGGDDHLSRTAVTDGL